MSTAQAEISRRPSDAMAEQIEKLRRNLLDIGTRNRLVSAPLKSSRANALEIIDERADQVLPSLWREASSFTFAANETPLPEAEVPGDDEDSAPVYVPPDDTEGNGVAARHRDNKLQTRLRPEPLQKRLIALQRDSALFEEEQGVNILFLAIGFLKWFEADSSDVERYAPLLLVPVRLERDRIRSRFRLRRRDDDMEENLSLQAKLKQDFGLTLPALPDADDWLPTDYFGLVEDAVSTKGRWKVQRDAMLLGFFSFSKFLLYRDLDPAQWPDAQKIDNNELVRGLLSEGFAREPLPIGENERLDELLDPAELGHVLDADSSQAAVVKMAADGHDMVVQGPPGTGKSQTIANVIAAAARQGKTILFVAEKMAALEVVHERLRSTGLDALCLELHSQKANKRAVFEELKRTLELGRVASATKDVAAETRIARDRLNHFSKLLHTPIAGISTSPFKVVATLVMCRELGMTPPEFTLDLDQLATADQNEAATAALQVLAQRTIAGGPSGVHPWRGVRRRLTPVDLQRLKPQLEELRSSAMALAETVSRALDLLGFEPNGQMGTPEGLLLWLTHFSRMPLAIERLIKNDPVRMMPEGCRNLLALADEVTSLHAQALGHSSEIGLEQDWAAARRSIAGRGRSLFRFLSGEYRRSVATLASVSVIDTAKTYDERLRRIDSIIAYQTASRRLAEADQSGRDAFAADWRGMQTDAPTLTAALSWYIDAKTLPSSAGIDRAIDRVRTSESALLLRDELGAAKRHFDDLWQRICAGVELDLGIAFPDTQGKPAPLLVAERVDLWLEDFDRLDEWFFLTACEDECRRLGLVVLVDLVAKGLLPTDKIVDAYKFAWAEAAWCRLVDVAPELATLRGDERTGLVERFRQLERELFVATAREIAAKHTAEIPTGAQGQMGFIRGQIARRRGHASIRTLMESAGAAVQKIKPIFLMSPISVAQFLPPGSVSFDLILMDEASQVRPEDAVGAIARARGVVVVGDNKQLPPTSFFDRTIGTLAADEDDDATSLPTAVSAGSMESILTLCQARGLPDRTLQWHYRSRHPSLIQVSNQAFYEHKLKFPPSPERAGRDGLVFRRIDGIYDRGKTRANQIEARAVANAVIMHARECPQFSLGVATLSVPQRDAILAELELLRAKHSELESFFDRSKSEWFFVKNLENVQGDERDVIFVSICYARDVDGYMAQGFGPVSSEGGERRLNVLFTRAKRRCEIFSSIGHGDIEVRGNVPLGRRVLHTYLKFAETGQSDVPTLTGLEPDSEFEVAVGNRIRSAGYEADFQVGSAGFRIDIGVRDPAISNAYILGIECDGAAYHSALWARERDRLRQQVLESKGWRLHRIWSTDWFNRPEAEFRKLLAAIDRAKAAHLSDAEADREAHETRIKIEREAAAREEAPSIPYEEADFPALNGYEEPHIVPIGLMAKYVTNVVGVEHPVHTDEIAKRVARAWGAQRTGSRIRSAVEKALNSAKADGKIEGGPYWRIPGASLRVRSRAEVASTSLRNPEGLPPEEINEAIQRVIRQSVAISSDELARGVADAFGFSMTTSNLKLTILAQAETLVEAGMISESSGLFRLADQI